jgi:predicted nucleic acid-binding protein
MLLALFPSTIAPKFKGVYSFFERIETGRLAVFLPELVLFQCYFVLTSFYDVPRPEAAEKLARLLQFRGIKMREKEVVGACLDKLQEKSLDLVDAYLLAWAESKGAPGIYSFDGDLATDATDILPIK